jgi:hypothetical protein
VKPFLKWNPPIIEKENKRKIKGEVYLYLMGLTCLTHVGMLWPNAKTKDKEGFFFLSGL